LYLVLTAMILIRTVIIKVKSEIQGKFHLESSFVFYFYFLISSPLDDFSMISMVENVINI